MKRLLLLSLLLFLFTKTKAQNNRWMYLTNYGQGITLKIDTLSNDTKQFDVYDGRSNVVTIWIKAEQKKSNKKGSFIESTLIHFAIDTASNQMAATSISIYHNNNPFKAKNFDYPIWQDAIPESGGDALISYCRALHNKNLMHKFIVNADLHYKK